jgi:hypothetical protein
MQMSIDPPPPFAPKRELLDFIKRMKRINLPEAVEAVKQTERTLAKREKMGFDRR